MNVHHIPGILKIPNVRIRQQRILLVRIEQRKILHDNGHQQIEYDVRNYHIECTKVHQTGGKIATIRFPVIGRYRTVRRLHHTIVHNLVPIFAGYNAKQHRYTGDGRSEIGPAPNALAILDCTKENGAGQRIEKHQQKHAEYDEKRFAHRHTNGQHQHFQRRMLAGYGEKTQNDHHEADEV